MDSNQIDTATARALDRAIARHTSELDDAGYQRVHDAFAREQTRPTDLVAWVKQQLAQPIEKPNLLAMSESELKAFQAKVGVKAYVAMLKEQLRGVRVQFSPDTLVNVVGGSKK